MLEIDDLSVAYRGGVTALDRVALTLPDAAVVAVLGANGAGKSTLLRAISGVLGAHGGSVTDGRIRFDGADLVGIDSATIVRRGVVQVPEGRRIFADLTVDENLRIGAHTVAADKRAERMERVHELFPILADRRNGRAGLLSGGEQQMLAIGRALMTEPRMLLLDEPSLGLAPLLVQQIGEIIRAINRTGTSVLLIEQNASIALAVADEAVVLETGRVRAAGPADELAATDEVRDRYLGIGTTTHTEDATLTDDTDDTDDTRINGRTEHAVRGAPPDVGDAALVATGVTVRFGGVTAVDDVDLELRPGSIHALIGPNGAGKSTFINVLSGVIRPTAGRVERQGSDLTHMAPHRFAGLGIARTFQNLSLSPEATVLDSILVGRHHLMRGSTIGNALRLPTSRREERAHREFAIAVAEAVAVDDRLDARIRELPYGDRKRVELARAICGEPQVLLLDEPVAGMTHGESHDMAVAIRNAHELKGFALLLVEHDMSFVMGLAETVTVLDFGARIAHGTPTEIQHDPAVQAAYLGVPAA